MPKSILTPRINNNDDFVRLIHVSVQVGAEVRVGDIVAEIETDKANFTVEAEQPGFVLEICHKQGDEVPVGSTLFWLGDTADEKPAVNGSNPAVSKQSSNAGASLKAQLLLRQYNLNAGAIQHDGPRLTAEDVERHIHANELKFRESTAPQHEGSEPLPSVPGKAQELNSQQRAMLRTVSWHRDVAVPGYIEFPYETKLWVDYAAQFQKTYGLMFDPLLSLLAFRLTSLVSEYPVINSTVAGNNSYVYDQVNLGFTVQSGSTLYMVVLQNAAVLGEKEFVDQLMALQRDAMKKVLRPETTTGATLAFTSMARWSIARHMPILPPHVSLIIAHAGASADGTSHLGATYDHRVLSGFDVAQILRELSRPPKSPEESLS